MSLVKNIYFQSLGPSRLVCASVYERVSACLNVYVSMSVGAVPGRQWIAKVPDEGACKYEHTKPHIDCESANTLSLTTIKGWLQRLHMHTYSAVYMNPNTLRKGASISRSVGGSWCTMKIHREYTHTLYL